MGRSFVARARASSKRTIAVSGAVVLVTFASCSGGDKPPAPASDTPLPDAGNQDATTTPVDDGSPMMTAPTDAGEAVEASDAASEAHVTPVTCVATDPDATDVRPMLCNGQCVNIDTDPLNCGGCSQPCGTVETICDFGVCKCPAAQSVCSGQCVDMTQDQSNCGFCGHNCQGNPCMAGLCQASNIAQVTLASEFLASIAVDSAFVYWTQGTSVASGAGTYSKPFAGGMPTPFLPATNDPRGIVVDLNYVYWVDYIDGSVNKAALLGGTATQLLPPGDGGTTGPLALAVDAQNVYWVDSAIGTVNKMPINGGAVTVLASGRSTPRAIAVDATYVYWIDYGSSITGNGSINKIAISGTPPITQLATSEIEPTSIALDGTSVYWTNRANPSGTVKSVPIGGGTIHTLAQSQGGPYGIAVDSQYVYWTNYDNNTVMKAPLAGGTAYTLASAQDNPSAIAVDQANVYWANYGSGFILKVAK